MDYSPLTWLIILIPAIVSTFFVFGGKKLIISLVSGKRAHKEAMMRLQNEQIEARTRQDLARLQVLELEERLGIHTPKPETDNPN